MKIQTNISVTINDGLSSSRAVVIEGVITSVVESANGDKLAFYKYIDQSNGEVLKDDSFPIPASNVQLMVDTFKANLPSTDTWNNMLWTAYYEGFKMEMVNTFSDLTSVSQISTIV